MRRIFDVKIGEYRILKVLGHGGSSVVYLAEDSVLQKQWAIKVTSNKESSALLEARLLGALEHPGIPGAVRFMEDDKNAYLVMDWCKGESLFELCRGRTPSHREVICWGIQLCGILQYLHSRIPPLIYRDLKPGNVMVDKGGKLKLVDFGTAVNLTETGAACRGTRGFAAPEQYEGVFNERTDIYNLGATLLWAAGKHPHKSLGRILKRSVCEKPDKRYENAAQFKAALLKLRGKGSRKRKLCHRIGLFFLLAAAAALLPVIANLIWK